MPVHEAPPDDDDDDNDNDNAGGGGGGDGGNTKDNNSNNVRSEQQMGKASEGATRGAADTSTKRREHGERPRQSYNVAPGYYELVYRAMVPDWGAGPNPHAPPQHQQQQQQQQQAQQKEQKEQQQSDDDASRQKMDEQGEHAQPAAGRSGKDQVRYRLQSMKWGKVFIFLFLHPMLFFILSLLLRLVVLLSWGE
jgi:hypothetical protein